MAVEAHGRDEGTKRHLVPTKIDSNWQCDCFRSLFATGKHGKIYVNDSTSGTMDETVQGPAAFLPSHVPNAIVMAV